jgi:YihY family inner membrane protein
MRARAVVHRFREADGTSHVRALAYQSAFVMISGFIGVVGLASVLGWSALRATVRELATRVAPGSSGRLLQEAVQQGSSGGTTATVIGLGAALVAGTLAMAQVERSAARLHDVTRDRPVVQRYALAAALAITAGVLLVVGGLVIGAGTSIATGVGWSGDAETVWAVVRWPIGLAIAGAGIALVYRAVVPGTAAARSILTGTAVALVLWAAFTALLGLYLSIGSTSSRTYGPLLSVIAMLLWAAATSLALHLGLAVIAEHRSAASPGQDRVDVPESSVMSRQPR